MSEHKLTKIDYEPELTAIDYKADEIQASMSEFIGQSYLHEKSAVEYGLFLLGHTFSSDEELFKFTKKRVTCLSSHALNHRTSYLDYGTENQTFICSFQLKSNSYSLTIQPNYVAPQIVVNYTPPQSK